MRKMGLALVVLGVMAGTAWGQPGPQPDKDGEYIAFRDVKPPKITSALAAVVPADLAGVKHISTLTMVIGTDGIPSKIEVMNSERSPLDDAAITAVKQTQFQPGTLAGKPVPVRIFVWVPFVDADRPPIPETQDLLKGKNWTPPKVVNNVEAVFSEKARRNHFSGIVMLAVVVTEDGLPTHVRVVAPLGMGLDEQAQIAARKYRFQPATLDGIPVPTQIMVEVNFRFYQDQY